MAAIALKGMESSFFHFVVPACYGQACGILDCVFGKYHPQGVPQSICRLDVRVLLEQYGSPPLLSVDPFVCGLEQQVTRAHDQLLTSVSIGKPVRDVFFVLLLVGSAFLFDCSSLIRKCRGNRISRCNTSHTLR